MKPGAHQAAEHVRRAFSILKRIELGETVGVWAGGDGGGAFSILKRIELGETI